MVHLCGTDFDQLGRFGPAVGGVGSCVLAQVAVLVVTNMRSWGLFLMDAMAEGTSLVESLGNHFVVDKHIAIT